jgi:hypothetical protein
VFLKPHIFIASGILIGVIFGLRAMDALQTPSFGGGEMYILGGFVMSGLLIRAGVIGLRGAKKTID